MAPLLDSATLSTWLNNTAEAMHEAGPQHFDMMCWFDAPNNDALDEAERSGMTGLGSIASVRDEYTITDCGTVACIAGWLTYMAPAAVIEALLEAEDDPDDDAPRALARLLHIEPQVWTHGSWSLLRDLAPSRYGMLNTANRHRSAVEFLRALAVEAETMVES